MTLGPPPGRGGPQKIPRPPDAVLGASPVWGGSHEPVSLADLIAVADHEALNNEPPPTTDGKPPSAVLIPLYDSPEGPVFIFTRRAWHLRSHPGQVSFPGGRAEPRDRDLVETALRETEEEIGLDRGLVQVVGEVERLTTVTSPANIVPILGVLDERPHDLVASPDEVDGILHVTVAELMDPSIFREELWFGSLPRPEIGLPPDLWPDGIPITFFELVGDTLWGATARIVRTMFESVVLRKRQTGSDPFPSEGV